MLKGIRECLAQSDGGVLKDGEIAAVLDEILGQTMWARRVLLVPPDITRYYSYAGRRDHGGLRRQRRNRGVGLLRREGFWIFSRGSRQDRYRS